MLKRIFEFFTSGFFGDAKAIVAAILVYADEVERPGDGEEKKKEVLQKLIVQLKKPGGIDLPAGVIKFLLSDLGQKLLSFAVDGVIAAVNKLLGK